MHVQWWCELCANVGHCRLLSCPVDARILGWLPLASQRLLLLSIRSPNCSSKVFYLVILPGTWEFPHGLFRTSCFWETLQRSRKRSLRIQCAKTCPRKTPSLQQCNKAAAPTMPGTSWQCCRFEPGQESVLGNLLASV